MQPVVTPIIRWAGSKRKLLPALSSRVPEKFERYIEPFAGSACLFFHLQPKQALLSDLNTELIQAYSVVRKHPLRVLRIAMSIPATAASYYEVRSMEPEELSPIYRSARFLYLNRYCFNALYRTNRMGHFNVPFGSKTGMFPSEVDFKRAVELLKRAELASLDFEAALDLAQPGDFVYLDPPYASRKRIEHNEYGCGSFTERDLPRLVASIELLHRRKIRFLLSYTKSDVLTSSFPKMNPRIVKVRRHIAAESARRDIEDELLLDNADIFGSYPK